MSLPITREVEIPPTIVMPCPELGFTKHVRVATVCALGCIWFDGLADRMSGTEDESPFSIRYAVRCRGVVERRCYEQPEIIG